MYTVLGKYKGKSKKSGNDFYLLHLQSDIEYDGLEGYSVKAVFCTKKVFDSLSLSETFSTLGFAENSKTCVFVG